jgi:methionine biosynthesis protein MetW
MRQDLEIVSRFVRDGARILDLGCGDGELLHHLQQVRRVNGYGLEIDAEHIEHCIARGVNVIEHDLDEGLQRFPDASFDMVVMTETLQAMARPDLLLDEMLRIGSECIVTFPNFAHWRCRLYLLQRGRMPKSLHLPHEWYDTPNTHLCTVRDFEALCRQARVNIVDRFFVDGRYRQRPLATLLPNVFGEIAFYRLSRGPAGTAAGAAGAA